MRSTACCCNRASDRELPGDTRRMASSASVAVLLLLRRCRRPSAFVGVGTSGEPRLGQEASFLPLDPHGMAHAVQRHSPIVVPDTCEGLFPEASSHRPPWCTDLGGGACSEEQCERREDIRWVCMTSLAQLLLESMKLAGLFERVSLQSYGSIHEATGSQPSATYTGAVSLV